MIYIGERFAMLEFANQLISHSICLTGALFALGYEDIKLLLP